MEGNNNERKTIIIAIAAIIIVLGAIFYFTAIKYKTPKTTPPTQDQSPDQSVRAGQVHNPAERLPDSNPYDAKTNPFEAAAPNPFKNVYKNPFSR